MLNVVNKIRKSLNQKNFDFKIQDAHGVFWLRESLSEAKALEAADELETELLIQDVTCTVKHIKIPNRKTRFTVQAIVNLEA